MIAFLRILWAVLWRSILVLALNTGIIHALSHPLSSETELSIKLRLSLTLLPAAIIFGALAARTGNAQSVLLELQSPMSFAQWRQTYAALAGCALLITVVTRIAALSWSTDSWLAFRTLLPLPMFLLVWTGVSIWQAYAPESRRRPQSS
ncbi:hypothetical protein [Rhizobium giardinii]|uniref:Uncharacterized protein n=1 Tax=Rhizobium giardinii TaxID=56731 RepID=A0A7W8XAE6_9HYPH|nr:hypothetical protein [Rhizobium giardinii]MBB5537617.1 hypothetical protein [Rhizobium giardinii]